MRLRHCAPVLAIAAAGALLPAAAVAADAPPAAPVPGTTAVLPLVSVSAGLNLDLLGIHLALGAPQAPPPTVPGDPNTLLGLSVGADVDLNVGPVAGHVDANVGAAVSQNAGAAVNAVANVSVPGVVDTGVNANVTVPPLNSGQAPTASVNVKGLSGATTPAAGSTTTPQRGTTSSTPPVNQQPPLPPPLPVVPRVVVPVPPPRGHSTGTRVKPKPVAHPRTVTPAATAPLGRTLSPALTKPADLPPLVTTDVPVADQVLDAAVATGRTLALPLALLAALLAYLGLQRLLDRGPKLAWADGRTPPDDELLEL